MGGVLPYKWEAYWRVSLSSKLRSQESTAIQTGGVLPYKLEVYCRTFWTSCRGWGFRNIAHGSANTGFCSTSAISELRLFGLNSVNTLLCDSLALSQNMPAHPTWRLIIVIFFSLTEAPLPDPTPTPPNTPKRTRNRPKTDSKRSQTEPNGAETEPNGAEMDRNQALRGGTGGGFVGVGGGWGVVREKEYH